MSGASNSHDERITFSMILIDFFLRLSEGAASNKLDGHPVRNRSKATESTTERNTRSRLHVLESLVPTPPSFFLSLFLFVSSFRPSCPLSHPSLLPLLFARLDLLLRSALFRSLPTCLLSWYTANRPVNHLHILARVRQERLSRIETQWCALFVPRDRWDDRLNRLRNSKGTLVAMKFFSRSSLLIHALDFLRCHDHCNIHITYRV